MAHSQKSIIISGDCDFQQMTHNPSSQGNFVYQPSKPINMKAQLSLNKNLKNRKNRLFYQTTVTFPKNDMLKTMRVQQSNVDLTQANEKQSSPPPKSPKKLPIIDHVKRNILRVGNSLVPNRDQILKEGGVAKWQRTRRQVLQVSKPASMFDSTHIIGSDSANANNKSVDEKFIEDVLTQDISFNRKYDEILDC